MIITIGREKGSGGHYAGELLAKQLGIQCYDKTLLIETAQKSGFHRNLSRHMRKQRLSAVMLPLPLA